MDKINNKYYVRIYDMTLVENIAKLKKSGIFSSTNDVLNKALKYGLAYLMRYCEPHLHLRLPSSEDKIQDELGVIKRKLCSIAIKQDEAFVDGKVVETLAAMTYNVLLLTESDLIKSIDMTVLEEIPDNLKIWRDKAYQILNEQRKREKTLKIEKD